MENSKNAPDLKQKLDAIAKIYFNLQAVFSDTSKNQYSFKKSLIQK